MSDTGGLQTQPENQGAPGQPPPAAPAAAPQQAQGKGQKIHQITANGFAELKKSEREKGRKAALEQLAKDNGFKTVEELLMAMPRLRQAGDPAPQPAPKNGTGNQPPKQGGTRLPDSFSDKDVKRWQRENEQLRVKNEQLAKDAQVSRRRVRSLSQQINDLEVTSSLKDIAVSCGITEVDFAIDLLKKDARKQTIGKTDEEASKILDAYDEVSFFNGLRESRPYLFGEVKRPATTGTGASGEPAAPSASDAKKAEAQRGKVDVSKMTRDEYEAYKRSLGL